MRHLLTALILLLTLYAPIELTRVIFNWGIAPQFIAEISIFWLLYFTGIYLVIYKLRNIVRD